MQFTVLRLLLLSFAKLMLVLNPVELNSDRRVNNLPQDTLQKKAFRSPFRYVVFDNELVDSVGKKEASLRIVSVLIDKEAFSESNLRELFSLVSKRYTIPNRLDIWVFTSLEQASTPEEKDIGYASGENDRDGGDSHHIAIFIRSDDGSEIFRYSTNLPAHNLKTVILKEKNKDK